VFHYVPLHTSPVGLSLGYEAGMLPVTESLSERLLRLPMYAGLEDSEVAAVVDSIRSFYGVR
jgi:dTDP-4-amino-4,6-dideoxygalactose transaminase